MAYSKYLLNMWMMSQIIFRRMKKKKRTLTSSLPLRTHKIVNMFKTFLSRKYFPIKYQMLSSGHCEELGKGVVCPLNRSGSGGSAEERACVWVTQLLRDRGKRIQSPGLEAAEISPPHVSAASTEQGTWKYLH